MELDDEFSKAGGVVGAGTGELAAWAPSIKAGGLDDACRTGEGVRSGLGCGLKLPLALPYSFRFCLKLNIP